VVLFLVLAAAAAANFVVVIEGDTTKAQDVVVKDERSIIVPNTIHFDERLKTTMFLVVCDLILTVVVVVFARVWFGWFVCLFVYF